MPIIKEVGGKEGRRREMEGCWKKSWKEKCRKERHIGEDKVREEITVGNVGKRTKMEEMHAHKLTHTAPMCYLHSLLLHTAVSHTQPAFLFNTEGKREGLEEEEEEDEDGGIRH